ncbi:MAG: prepilin peptidase [Myxococcota bacterium]
MGGLTIADVPAWGLRAFAFVFGALWGSFWNVAIYRWPREMSVVSPPSHCPACGAPVPAWRNLPIVAYLMQRGRAACCAAPMTPRYVAVEVLGGVLCLAVVERFVLSALGTELALLAPDERLLVPRLIEALLYFVFLGGLVVATFVDLEWMIIPDEVSLPGAALGLATLALRPHGIDAVDAALGAGLGYLVVQLLFVYAYEAFTGRRGMGEGDAKLLLFIGAFVGWKGVLFALVAGSMQGLLVAVVAMVTKTELIPEKARDELAHDPGPFVTEATAAARCLDEEGGAAALLNETTATNDDAREDEGDEISDDARAPLRMPFGPFLALGAAEFLFFGDALIDAYLGLFPAP